MAFLGPSEEAAGRACYEAFAAAMSAWMPAPPEWSALSLYVRKGWIAAALAARKLES